MNMFKKNGGFTLVELIVVIAILAILAGVAVPAYSGYIERANDAACLAELSAIQTATQSACALNGTTLDSITIGTEISVVAEDDTVDVSEDFEAFYTSDASVVIDLLEKHSEYESVNKSVSWSVAEGWNILADDDSTPATT